MGWLHTVAIDEAGNLNATIRQVIDQVGIAYIAVDHCGTVQCHCLNNIGTVFVAAGKRNIAGTSQHLMNGGIVLGTPGGPVIGIETGLTQVALTAVTFDQIRAFAEVGNIL